jgi:hypothetical protein
MREPDLSIIVAAWPDLAGLEESLAALAPQRDSASEILVASPAAPDPELETRFPWVQWVETDADCLIPHLWARGMARAHGAILAITTSHFTAAPDWIPALREAHGRLEAPAIGGPMEPPRAGRAVDWATYFLRYSSFLAYTREQAVADIAGDNASYKRAALEAHADALRDGFWELDLHRHLRAEGKSIVFVPEIRLTQRRSFGFLCFLGQRFHHGQQFGRTRLQGRSLLARALAMAASPLIPLVFLGKIIGRVARSGRDWGPFLWALPVLISFLLAWSLGEAWGYFGAERGRKREALQPEGVCQ